MAHTYERERAAERRDEAENGGWLSRTAQAFYVAGKDFLTDNGPQWAAALAYYSLLSLFPLILVVATVASYVAFDSQQAAVGWVTGMLGEYLPRGQGTVEQAIRQAFEARGSIGLLSFVALLWSGSRVFGVVARAMNIAFDVDEAYSFLKRLGVEVVMLVTLGLLFILAFASSWLISVLWSRIGGLPGQDSWLFTLATDGVQALILFVAILLTYRYVPRKDVKWQAALIGAIVATLLFVIARPLFLGYVGNFGRFNLVYGSLAAIIIIVVWAWVVGMLLIFGGEVASHYQAVVLEHQPAREVEREHKRRSPLHKDEPG